MSSQPAPTIATRDLDLLARHAHAIRVDVLRMIAPIGQGYVQQGLGAAEIFAVLYFAELRLDPGDPRAPLRDRCLLSTAHNSAVFHATLAARGLLPREQLAQYCQDGSPVEINVSERLGPLVEATCGSLGQGLSVAVGMALAGRRRGLGYRVYVILGDGELQEGQVWEAAMAAGSYGLDNLCVVLDLNRMQVEGDTDRVLKMQPIADKLSAFGFHVQTCDGHDLSALLAALDEARSTRGKPSLILAQTIAGKGVPFLEGKLAHHMKLPAELAAAALSALGVQP
jgi:transketolase